MTLLPYVRSLCGLLVDQPSPYQTLRISGQHIRLLDLLPGKPDEAINCKLFVADLGALSKPYSAVSYTWGPPDRGSTITLDERSFTVRKNLHGLLCTFRRSDRKVTLWIDAICIDHSSIEERNHQVGIMGEIFRKADIVNVWLGSTYAGLDTAIATKVGVPPLAEDPSTWTMRDMYFFQRNVHWTRAWIVQELVLAKDITIYWGGESGSLTWDGLLKTVSVFDKNKAEMIRAIAVMRMVDEEERSFQKLFARFGHLDCAIVHDKFYSLYGMANDLLDQSSVTLLPDYSLCITEVFMRHFSSREGQSPVRDPLDFVRVFSRHFHQGRRGFCDCHGESSIEPCCNHVRIR